MGRGHYPINNCYNTGSVFSISSNNNSSYASYAGGIGGLYYGYILNNCYNTGDISSTALSHIGGIVGEFSGDNITNCYNIGVISSLGNIGGICGSATSTTNVSNSYCLNLYGSQVGTQLTSSQMKDKANYMNWDFDEVWDIDPNVNEGYPFLRNISTNGGTSLTLSYLKDIKFPQGTYWNKLGSSVNGLEGEDRCSNTPCPQVLVDGKWKHAPGTSTCNVFPLSTSSQCLGFAEKLAYDVYNEHSRNWDEINKKDDGYKEAFDNYEIKPGDHIRYDGHSVFVVYVDESGEKLTVADCNSDYRCGINWERIKKKSDIRKNLEYLEIAPYSAEQLSLNIPGRQVKIACPVDVEVYDDMGRLAARVINNVADDDIDAFASIAAFVEGDTKIFMFGGGFDYTFKLIGTNNGSMDLEISDMVSFTPTGEQKEFVNVVLENGKLFEFTVGSLDETEVSEVQLFVTDGEKTIAEVMEDGTEISNEEPPVTCGCCDKHNHGDGFFDRIACFFCQIWQWFLRLFGKA